MEEKDVLIIGSGPAGLSAAINATIRNKTVMVISNDQSESGLFKAEKISNYMGLPGLSGSSLLETFGEHAKQYNIEVTKGKVLSIMPFGDKFMLSYGSEVATGQTVIIAAGVVPSSTYRGELDLLGRGVSYCATCDGMLYRGKKVCVTGNTPDLLHEINYLKEIGCEVEYIKEKIVEIKGQEHLEAVITQEKEIICDGLFVLRKAVAYDTLLPGLETENGYIKVNRALETSQAGVFAAGDCTGKPLQVAKAVGEGLVAGLNAAEYVDKMKNSN